MVKAAKGQIDRAVRAPGEWRFFLLYGPDDSGSRALAKAAGKAMGDEAERIDLSGSELKNDPARLPDEASSISLFGGARYIVVEPAGDECHAAVEALLQSPPAGNPVILVGGALKPASKLLKLALAEPTALVHASYAPEGQEADRLAMDKARELGLIIRPDLARRLASACGGNRAVLASELEKLALFVDATPESPKQADHDALDAIGAAQEEGDLSRFVDAVSAGRPDVLGDELARLASQGIEGIPLIRAVLRRMTMLSRLRAEVDRGNNPGAVMASHGKAIFWKEKDAIAAQLRSWRSDLLAKSVGRLLEAERQAKASGGLGAAAVDEEMFAICRQAARLR
ncbi:MAG TPA: DNA polymerase III subunit delta [Allosphingosinicella sp.]